MIRDDQAQAGYEALARGDWQAARTCFEASLQERETAEALEGLGMAAWWLNDADVTFAARERAYHLYRMRGDVRASARVASYLAIDHFYFRGEYAVANGWIERGRRLVEGLAPGAELGMLALVEAKILIWAEHDFVTAQQRCSYAYALGKSLGDVNLELAALAFEGFALVAQGRMREGMRRLDQAALAAIAGEMSDADAACTACCSLIFACEWTRDYERAAQWIERLRELAMRWQHPTLVAFCRVHYVGLLVCYGKWHDAERELLSAIAELEAAQPATAAEGLWRLADLRCRQGQFEEAERLFAQMDLPPYKALIGDFAHLGRAMVALAHNMPENAIELAEKFLRTIPSEDRLERIAGMELLIQALVAAGETERALYTLAEFKEAVSDVTTRPMQAALYFAEGLIRKAQAGHSRAKHLFEDAAELWGRAAIPYEAARAQLELAETLLALHRRPAAAQAAHQALQTFEQLGAKHDQARAFSLLHQIESSPVDSTTSQDKMSQPAKAILTVREREILHLIANGMSNQEIARELVISVRTTERHISNIYAKLGLEGKSARAAATAYALRNGLSNS